MTDGSTGLPEELCRLLPVSLLGDWTCGGRSSRHGPRHPLGCHPAPHCPIPCMATTRHVRSAACKALRVASSKYLQYARQLLVDTIGMDKIWTTIHLNHVPSNPDTGNNCFVTTAALRISNRPSATKFEYKVSRLQSKGDAGKTFGLPEAQRTSKPSQTDTALICREQLQPHFPT